MVNVLLGAPYEEFIQKRIALGYAGTMSEVIRQALLALEKQVEEEEVLSVHRAVEKEMQEIRSGRKKVISLEEVEKKFGGET